MILIKQLHEWSGQEIYQEYVKMLLEQNPLVETIVKEQAYGKRRGKRRKSGFKTRKVYASGYWTKFNKKARWGSHYWVYTKKVVGGRHRVVEVISYKRFMKMLDVYFTKARDFIIAGYGLKIGAGVGNIQGMHVERNHKNRKINWNETKKQPLIDVGNGMKSYAKKIYYTDDSWVRIGWARTNTVRNERTYTFAPCSEESADGDGFKDIFTRAHHADPLLKLKYPWYPYIQNTA